MALNDILGGLMKLFLRFSCFSVYLFSGCISQFRNPNVEINYIFSNVTSFYLGLHSKRLKLDLLEFKIICLYLFLIKFRSWGGGVTCKCYQNSIWRASGLWGIFLLRLPLKCSSVSDVSPRQWLPGGHIYGLLRMRIIQLLHAAGASLRTGEPECTRPSPGVCR